MNTAQCWSAALAVCALGAGLSVVQRPPAGESEPAAAAPQPQAQHGATVPARAPVHTQAPDAPAEDEPSLNTQVARLLASHNPADAFRAYVLVANCATFNADHDRLVDDPEELKHWKGNTLPGLRPMNEREKQHDAKLCGQMTERERQARLDYLDIALKAGVPGAATSFALEGPFGDPSALQTRPDDPLVKEWKAAARAHLTRAADSGTDYGALNRWAFNNQFGSDITEKNPAVAYGYLLAIGLIQADLFGAEDMLAKIYAQDSDMLTGLAAGLAPEQRTTGLAAAKAIAARARAARKAARAAAQVP